MYEEFESLIYSGDASDLTMQDNNGNTPLHLASSINSLFMVIRLCSLRNNLEFF